MASRVSSKAASQKILLSKSSTRKSADILNEQLYSAVAQANKIGDLLDKRLSFDIDNNKTNMVVVKVVDKSTGKVVRVLPPGEMLKMAAHLKQLKVLNDRVIGAAESVILDYN